MSKRVSLFFIIFILFFSISFILAQEEADEAAQEEAIAVEQTPIKKIIVHYKMDVKLNTDKKEINGEEELTWLNDSDKEIDELYFHLYLNAFKNNQSTFIRDAFSMVPEFVQLWGIGPVRNLLVKKEYFGYCDVKSIKLLTEGEDSEADLSSTMEYVQPDDDNKLDQTVLKVTLPKPVSPGEKITLNISFVSKLPRAMVRTGYVKDYYFVAQWFPKIGVLWDGEWNCHQFHIMGEFFANFGIYDVKLTIPKDYKIGATGKLKGEPKENSDNTVTYNYYQEDVHDFTWTASEDYLVYKKTFQEKGLKDVKMTLLLQPEHKYLKDRYFRATECALKYYGLWYGEYPYGHITIVDPAHTSMAGGMEYPTLFTGGAKWLSPKEVLSPEGVTVHEAGHQWWYGLVANNEFEDAWLDEGFNTYSETRAQLVEYGPDTYVRRYFGFPLVYHRVKRPHFSDQLDGHRQNSKLDDMSQKSWEYLNFSSYAVNSYDKPALMLRTLENFLGEELFFKIMKTYFNRYKYKHPRQKDFIQIVNEISGQDMNWFFDQIAYGSGEVDYAIHSVSSRSPASRFGIFDKKGKKVFLSGSEENKTDKSKKEKDRTAEKKKEKTIYTSDVVVRRIGDVRIPVEVLIVFENGDKVTKQWDGQYRWIKYTFKKPSKLEYAQVDPEHKLVLDVNYTNNSKRRESKSFASYKWASRWMFWLQHLMETFCFLS